MIAIRSARGNHFVKKLLEFLAPEDLGLRDNGGMTALHHAAIAGNTEAAKFLVDKNPDLPNYCSNNDVSPLLQAATFCRRKMVVYLLDVTKTDITPKLFEDIALLLIRCYPELAWVRPYSALTIIASKSSSAFKSGAHLNWWQNLLYSYVLTKLEDSTYYHSGGDIENPTNNSFLSVKQKLHYAIWKVSLIFVPHMKYIREIKLKHEKALQLVKHLCSESLKLNY
ncbi:uncharacterized protein LOC132293901 isoform X4 [Cornus florida]|uniref:uncharacterized protein LOC132293901 isoform X4 n=1 Tax=Cornus florida TaxID=4283 RepID=UPI0028A2470E|nr:uncharacterized protein LOC132293901 isoform X4 [Cornus florida]